MAAKEFTRVLPEFEKHRHEMVAWKAAMHQSAGWYGSAEAARIAKNVIAYQHGNGGWTKNVDMALPNVGDTAKEGTTIDNGATHTQLRYLAKVYEATKRAEYLAAINNGVDYLLAAQYSNGGWPQFYPLRHGYWDHITYNDDAMIGVMELLRDISKLVPEKSAKIQGALGKGLEVILKTQIREGGKLTAWCAQHDEITLAPAMARKYEHPSISGSESVGVVEYLMSIARPSPEVIAAIHGAVNWFKANRIPGIRIERVNGDKVVVQDAEAPPQWARFYELGTDKPIFSGRDSVVKYSIAEIEAERRNGYNWYSDRPAKLLTAEYPAWVQRNGLGK